MIVEQNASEFARELNERMSRGAGDNRFDARHSRLSWRRQKHVCASSGRRIQQTDRLASSESGADGRLSLPK